MSESTIDQVTSALEGQGDPAGNAPAVQTTEQEPQSTATPQDSDLVQGVLKDIPEAERPIVQKYLQQWDQQVQQRFQSVHSEYEGWKPLKDQGLDPAEVQQLIALGEALNANPAETVQAIIEAYNLQNFLQGQQTQQQGAPVGNQQQQPTQQQLVNQALQTGQVSSPEQLQAVQSLPPEILQRLTLVDTMAQYLIQQQEIVAQSQADQQLDQTLKSLEQAHGSFDEKWVLTLASQTGDLEGAVQEYKALEARLMQQGNAPAAPTVLGAGGGLPATDVDPTKLGSKETKALVTQMLLAGQQQT